MPETLRPEGFPVHVGDVVLITPGLVGEAEVHPPSSPGMRAAEDATDQLQGALAGAGLGEQLTVQITGQTELDGNGGSRAGGGGDVDDRPALGHLHLAGRGQPPGRGACRRHQVAPVVGVHLPGRLGGADRRARASEV